MGVARWHDDLVVDGEMIARVSSYSRADDAGLVRIADVVDGMMMRVSCLGVPGEDVMVLGQVLLEAI